MKETPATIKAGASRPEISVVIPNLDGAHWLKTCLPSLSGYPPGLVEVIVADDGSSDTSHEMTRSAAARFLAAPNARTGFAATANRGIQAATGTWIFLLNNDTEVAPGALTELLAGAQRNPDASMIAPLVLSLRDRERIDSAGMLLFPDGTARPRWHGQRSSDRTMGEEEVLMPSGAAAMIRRDAIERVGLLDESLVSYLEDIDLGLRIRRVGGRSIFVPTAVVFHHFSGTTGAMSPLKARLIERNHITVAIRHLPGPLLLGLPFWTLARWSVLAVAVARARGASSDDRHSPLAMVSAVLGGTAAGLMRTPQALSERRGLERTTTVDAHQWRRLLRTHRAQLRDYLHFGE